MQVYRTTPEIQLELGRKLKELRLSRNITQSEIARKTGSAESSIIRLERTGTGSIRTLVHVLRVLDADLSEIIPQSAAAEIKPMEMLEETTTQLRQRARRPRV